MSASGPTTAAPSLLTGLAWTSALRWSAQVIAWASTLILVRVLSPTDYGTVAVAATVVGWVTIFADMGLSGSIQTTDVRGSHEYGRMLGQSIGAGVVLSALVAIVGPFLADVFRQDALRQLLPVLSVCIVLDGARGVLSAIMMRSLQNRGLASLDLVRSVLQTVVVFVCALSGFGYWSLAIGQITASALGMLAMLVRVGIRPIWPSAEHWKASLVRGKHFMTTAVMWQSYTNADIWVLSRVVGPAAVGAYSLARTLASMPSDKIVTVVTGVTNGYVANAKSDSAALKRLYLALTHGVALVTALPLAGLAATADLAVPVLLGERWIAVVTPLRFMCIGAFLWSLNTVAFQVAANAEKIRGLSISSAAAVPFSYAAYFVAARLGGTTGVAAAWIAVVIFVALPVIVLANRTSHTTLREYLAAHADAVKVIGIVLASTYAVRWVIPHTWPSQLALAVLACVGGLAGGVVIWRSPMPSVVALKAKLFRRTRTS